jgi:hypothetical protein
VPTLHAYHAAHSRVNRFSSLRLYHPAVGMCLAVLCGQPVRVLLPAGASKQRRPAYLHLCRCCCQLPLQFSSIGISCSLLGWTWLHLYVVQATKMLVTLCSVFPSLCVPSVSAGNLATSPVPGTVSQATKNCRTQLGLCYYVRAGKNLGQIETNCSNLSSPSVGNTLTEQLQTSTRQSRTTNNGARG